MKNINFIKLEKYNDAAQFKKISECIYQNLVKENYSTTISCVLEEGEDNQYPLEDILDKYFVNCTDFFEEKTKNEITTLSLELETLSCDSDDYNSIVEISRLVGKRVYNKNNDDGIELIIE